jgi:hypothetical protein
MKVSRLGPTEVMRQGGSPLDEAGNLGALELTDALQQPLTAACNYIGAARILLRSGKTPPNEPLVQTLEMAETQILRAGDVIRQFQRTALRQSNN